MSKQSKPSATSIRYYIRVRDYMAAHTKRMERFENAIFRQREEINGRMIEMFGLFKELTTKKRKKKNDIYNVATGDDSKETDRPDMEVSHRINEKLIEGLLDNNRFNDSPSGARVRKKKGKTYNVLPRGPVYEAILKKKITKKEDIRGNFEIPCSIGGLKHRPAETDIRLLLASHSYIYPLGIVEDVLVEIVEHEYPVEFVILDIKEDEKRPFILGTPFLTTAKAVIKFDKGTITLRSGKSKISFHRIPESPSTIEKGVKNDIEPIAPTMTMNRLVLE
ncbi:zinc finger, CCHC-type containing protein [Tanacetum coccineum]